MSVAHEYAGASINDITDDSFVEPLTGQAIGNGVPVATGKIVTTVVVTVHRGESGHE